MADQDLPQIPADDAADDQPAKVPQSITDENENQIPDEQEDTALKDEANPATDVEKAAGVEATPAAEEIVSEDTDTAREASEPVEKPKDEEVI